MTNLYARLDVDHKASKADIRRAYRRRARKDHPDTGGSPTAFALTKLAHDILTDDERRAKYDATGDTSEKTIDNRQAQILEHVAALLNATLDNCAKANRDPLTMNLAVEMSKLATQSIAEYRKQRSQVAAHLPLANKLLGRFKRKKNKSEPNTLEALMLGRVAGINDTLRIIDTKITMFEEAKKIVDDYDFAADPFDEIRVPISINVWR